MTTAVRTRVVQCRQKQPKLGVLLFFAVSRLRVHNLPANLRPVELSGSGEAMQRWLEVVRLARPVLSDLECSMLVTHCRQHLVLASSAPVSFVPKHHL